jgi:hypothetical protein
LSGFYVGHDHLKANSVASSGRSNHHVSVP